MKMKVVDQLHISSLGPQVMGKGHPFEIADAEGEQLEKRGLATRVADVPEGKAEPEPQNKAEHKPANKAERAPRTKQSKRRR